MKALVTGAGGFLGRHLVAELLRGGDEVAAMLRPSRTIPPELEGADIVRADLRRRDALQGVDLASVDAIYHLAASLMPPWRSMFEANVTATERLLDALLEANWRGRFVHVSTFAVYALNQLEPNSLVDESAPLEPHPGRRDDYAWTKLLQERLVRRFGETPGVELVIVRPGAVYGSERAWQHRAGRQLSSRVVLMFGGRNLVPLSYVANTASLLAAAGRHPDAPGEVFNAVDPDPPTQRAYLARWRAAQRGPTLVIPVPLSVLRLAGAGFTVAERLTRGSVAPPGLLRPYVITPTMRPFRYASRAEEVLGWRPPVARDDALRMTLDRTPPPHC